jgi:hypothetical protein
VHHPAVVDSHLQNLKEEIQSPEKISTQRSFQKPKTSRAEHQ